MSFKFGTPSIPGAFHYGGGGLGVLGDSVPSNGLFGASYLWNDVQYNDLQLSEVMGRVETPPSAGVFFPYEDGSFTLIGAPDGVYTFTYRLFVDGVDSGTATVTITIGASLTGNVSLDDVGAAGVVDSALPAVGRPESDISANSWVPSAGLSLSAMVNEQTPNDGTYISSISPSTCELQLNNTRHPGGASQALSYRASSESGSTLTMVLKQGAAVIATRSHALTADMRTYRQRLTPQEIALIAPGPLSVQITVA